MESQLTLVHPPSTTTTYHFTFRHGSMEGDIHEDLSRPPLYTIRTGNLSQITEILVPDSPPRVVAFIKSRTFGGDEVWDGRGSGSPKKQKDWLKRVKLPNGWPSTVMETPDGAYVWRSWPKQRLALYERSDTEFDSPLVYLTLNPYKLVVENKMKHLHIDMILAMIVLERKLSEGEHKAPDAFGRAATKWWAAPFAAVPGGPQ